MSKIYSSLSLIILVALLSSCRTEKPLSTGPANNNETYKVEYLFEHDGCKVYRFFDMGNYVYFTNCTGDVTAISTDSLRERRYTITNQKQALLFDTDAQ